VRKPETTDFCDVYTYTATKKWSPIPVNLTATSVPSYWFIPSSYIFFFLLGFPFVSVGGRHETDCANHVMPPTQPHFPFLTWKSFLKFYFLRRLNIGDLLPRPVVVGLEMKWERELKFLWNMCQHTRIWIAVEMFHIGLKKELFKEGEWRMYYFHWSINAPWNRTCLIQYCGYS
jgi:hypothetical protein